MLRTFKFSECEFLSKKYVSKKFNFCVKNLEEIYSNIFLMKIGLNFSDNFQTLCMVRTVRTRADLDQYDNWQIILKWHLLTCAFSWWPRAQKNSLSTNHRKANLKKKLVFFFVSCWVLDTCCALKFSPRKILLCDISWSSKNLMMSN